MGVGVWFLFFRNGWIFYFLKDLPFRFWLFLDWTKSGRKETFRLFLYHLCVCLFLYHLCVCWYIVHHNLTTVPFEIGVKFLESFILLCRCSFLFIRWAIISCMDWFYTFSLSICMFNYALEGFLKLFSILLSEWCLETYWALFACFLVLAWFCLLVCYSSFKAQNCNIPKAWSTSVVK